MFSLAYVSHSVHRRVAGIPGPMSFPGDSLSGGRGRVFMGRVSNGRYLGGRVSGVYFFSKILPCDWHQVNVVH